MSWPWEQVVVLLLVLFHISAAEACKRDTGFIHLLYL